jgi:hypothetical protein
MKDIDLEKYRSAWEEEKSFNVKILSRSEQGSYLKRRSKGIVSSFRTALAIDAVLKIALCISFITLIFLYSNQTVIVAACSILFALTGYLLLLEFKTYRKIPGHKEYSVDIRTFLERGIRFYRTEYFKTLYFTALSSPLILISGMFFYHFYKYAGVRALDFIDVLVIGLFCLAGFILSAIVYTKNFGFRIRQMQECLDELNSGGIDEMTVRKHARHQKMILIVVILLLIIGLALFGLIIMS